MNAQHTPEAATSDLSRYGRALRTNNTTAAIAIEKAWGLYGYTPQIVSSVLGCVATGLPLEAAIKVATEDDK